MCEHNKIGKIKKTESHKLYLDKVARGEKTELEPTLYPRKSDNCGKGMNEGWCWDMGYACSDKCLFVDGYTKSQLEKDLEMDTIYWTEWEELDYDENYNKNGDKITNLYADANCYDNKGNVANFLLHVKGEPLLNNGTGFLKNKLVYRTF